MLKFIKYINCMNCFKFSPLCSKHDSSLLKNSVKVAPLIIGPHHSKYHMLLVFCILSSED